jgi:hypothetical protein
VRASCGVNIDLRGLPADMRVLLLMIGATAVAGVIATMYRAVWAYRRVKRAALHPSQGRCGIGLDRCSVPNMDRRRRPGREADTGSQSLTKTLPEDHNLA